MQLAALRLSMQRSNHICRRRAAIASAVVISVFGSSCGEAKQAVGPGCLVSMSERLVSLPPTVDGTFVGDPALYCSVVDVARDASGFLPCRMTWELPLARDAALPHTPISCDERPEFLSVPSAALPRKDANGRTLCEVRQLPVVNHDTAHITGEGFYVDDASDVCPGDLTTIAYTANATPPNGIRIHFECLDDAQHFESGSPDIPSIGDPCDRPKSYGGGPALEGDALCNVERVSGGAMTEMFCHPDKHVCVRGCQIDAQCPNGWVCDSGAGVLSRGAGRPVCTNPSCDIQ
jgi:hypothetical protein